ncbi:LysE family translocator [Metasolibacillus meyeri]|uniref:LysE family translocator n=1 Tax=Metasolibacillus meyeri TaxID=1071052 RepID=UPI000D30BB45|nr:LysE family translocator [Metasolibacillus meyeri]
MENFLLYLFMCIMLIILPGPDTAIVTKNTLLISKKAGLQTMAGTLCALMIHTSAAVLGLSAIIVKSAVAFSIIKYIGAIYLLYLGVKTLIAMTKRKPQLVDAASHKNDSKSSFTQGFLTNLLNPKVAVFFLTFLPQFLATNSDPLLPFFIMGITYTALTAAWFVGYIYLLHQIRAFMNKPSTQKVMEGVTGAVLILFGVKLALEKAN